MCKCHHRSPEPIGTIYCGCAGVTKPVHWCDLPQISGYVTIHATPIKRKRVRLNDGSTDEIPSLKLPVCVLCHHRPDAPPELTDLLVRQEPPPNPSPPVRSESLQNALAAICSNCPRIDAKGLPVTCSGPESASCPQSLWPTGKRFKGTPGKNCRNCG